VCNMSPIVRVALCAVFCVILCDMCICVLCFIVVPLPPGKTPSVLKLNIKTIIIIIIIIIIITRVHC
jgi:hypothetical protein